VGVVGADETGARLLERFRALGVDTSAVVVASGYVTPAKTRIVAGGIHTRRQQVVRIDRGGGALPGPAQQAVDRALRATLRRAEGVVVADYGYGAATPERVAAHRSRLTRRRAPVFVDSRARVADYRGVDACTPNQEELERALGIDTGDEAALLRGGNALLRRSDLQAVLLTRGALGMCLFERGLPPVPIAAFGSDEVADVTGAGDTVIAVFALARLAGAGYADAARLANYAAGLVVMKAGTATVEPGELERAVRKHLTGR
jgi:rfaE bifunctional protein kinase chain/domain